MVWFRLAAAAAALLVLGPVVDPHGHDPYHAHWILSEGLQSVEAKSLPVRHLPGQRWPEGHPPGVVWLRGSDSSAPAVLHAGALLPAAACTAVLQPPQPAGQAPSYKQPAWSSPPLDPEDPPPRRA